MEWNVPSSLVQNSKWQYRLDIYIQGGLSSE